MEVHVVDRGCFASRMKAYLIWGDASAKVESSILGCFNDYKAVTGKSREGL